jgi:hypothetical protein
MQSTASLRSCFLQPTTRDVNYEDWCGAREILTRRKRDGRKLTSSVMGLFTGPHHTSFSDVASFTTRLSEGERPVLAPEYALRAPDDVMADPVS